MKDKHCENCRRKPGQLGFICTDGNCPCHSSSVQRFISDAIAGGWKPKDAEMQKVSSWKVEDGLLTLYGLENKTQRKVESYLIEQPLLDPTAWRAVGKTRGWAEDNRLRRSYESFGSWRGYKLLFNEHIDDGESIEEALTAIEV